MAWTIDTELLALIAELVHTHIRTAASIAGAKKHQLPKPLEIDRPYSTRREPRTATVQDVAAAFAGMLDLET